jgi:hypothetical protein
MADTSRRGRWSKSISTQAGGAVPFHWPELQPTYIYEFTPLVVAQGQFLKIFIGYMLSDQWYGQSAGQAIRA